MLKSAKPYQSVLLVLGILILVFIGVNHTYPSTSSSLLAPPLTTFSSTRAMSHVWKIGSKPHPTGSYQNEIVRNYLVDQLIKLDLNPEVQSAFVVSSQKQYAGRVHNIVVRIPGKKAGKALLLTAHYDSVHTGSGAADNGASVAAILETLRALKTHFPLQNDLICLFSDSEESGLLGAEAFVKQHPFAENIGLVLNFEYRGNRGAFMMFETSQGNGKLIEGLVDSAPFVLANSLMYEVYRRLPNDTDLSVFKQAGIPGINFAAIEGFTSYHTQLDSPAVLDQETLQQEGDIMLALVRHFGDSPLDNLKTADQVYFDLPGVGIVNYPVSWVIPLSVILLIFFVLITALACKKKVLKIKRVLSAGLLFPIIVLVLALASHLMWLEILRLHPEYLTFVQGDIYNSHWYLMAFVLINIGIFWLLLAFLGKWFKPLEFLFGVMIFWMALNFLCAIWLPGASFMLLWPLAAMLIAVGMIFLSTNVRSPLALILVSSGSIPGIIIFTSLIKSIYIALTPHMISVVVCCLAILLGLLSLLIELIGQRKLLVSLCLISGGATLLAVSMRSGFDSHHPRQQSLLYALDSQGQNAFWLSADKQMDQWTSAFFNKPKKMQFLPEIFGDQLSKWWVSPAPVFSISPPIIEKLQDSLTLSGRNVKINIKSAKQSSRLKISLEGADVLSSKIEGQVYSDFRQTHWNLNLVGLFNEGLVIEFIVQPDRPFIIRVLGINFGIEEFLLKPLPSYLINSPSELSDTKISVNTLKVE